MNRMEYEIADRADIEELYALQRQAFESEAEMIGSHSVPALMESRDENRADFENWTVLVRRDDAGKIIGAVRYKKVDGHVDVGRLMVAPEHRNRGVASGLMRAVEETAREKTYELYTCTKSYTNIRLYEQLGYRIFKEERGEHGLSFAYMRKTVENGKVGEKGDNVR